MKQMSIYHAKVTWPLWRWLIQIYSSACPMVQIDDKKLEQTGTEMDTVTQKWGALQKNWLDQIPMKQNSSPAILRVHL